MLAKNKIKAKIGEKVTRGHRDEKQTDGTIRVPHVPELGPEVRPHHPHPNSIRLKTRVNCK